MALYKKQINYMIMSIRLATKCSAAKCSHQGSSHLANFDKKHRKKILQKGFDRMLQGREKLAHSPVVKILSSSCFPRKRGGGFAYTSYKVGTEGQSFTTEVYHGWFWIYFRMVVGQFVQFRLSSNTLC